MDILPVRLMTAKYQFEYHSTFLFEAMKPHTAGVEGQCGLGLYPRNQFGISKKLHPSTKISHNIAIIYGPRCLNHGSKCNKAKQCFGVT